MKMTTPLLTQLACLYIIYYVFAMIGMYGMGGLIRQPNFHSEGGIPNNLYYMVNFNDLGNSITTLFAFMIINNWPAMTDMMVNATGEKWPRVYFMVFYVLVQWIILNIVIAMMLDVFTNVESELDKEFANLASIKRLQKAQKQLGNGRFEEICQIVNEDILMDEKKKQDLRHKALKTKHDAVSNHPCFNFDFSFFQASGKHQDDENHMMSINRIQEEN